MTYRDEILVCVRRLIRRTGQESFTLQELVDAMPTSGTAYKETTIRTRVTSRMCANVSQNHAVKYSDFERVGKDVYRVRA